MATINFDTFINIIKRPESIHYKTKVGSISANIAYVGTKAISSEENISIADYSGYIHSNRVFENEIIDYSNLISLEIKTSNFLLTDIYSVASSAGSLVKTPLFFKHTLKSFETNDVLKNIKFFDGEKQEIIITDIYKDETNGFVYSNLESSYKTDSLNLGESAYTFYYVQYTIVRSNTEALYTELLDNKPVYREATIEDFNMDDPISSFLLKATDQVYTLEETTDSFLLTFATARSFSYKNVENRKLNVLKPTLKDYTDPWHIRVTNGKVFYQNKIYKISDEQFFAQNFNPTIGTKKVQKEIPTIINKRVIKTDYENLNENSTLELFIDIRVSDKDGVKREYLTTNPSHTDSEYEVWGIGATVGIKSVDHHSGFIEIEGLDLSFTDKIECDYYFIEDYYDFTEVDFNPIRNDDILKRKTVIYIDPTPLETNSTLRFKQFYHDGSAISGATYTTWLEENTIEGSGDFFVLAEIVVGESIGTGDIVSLDTRIEGNAVKESRVAKVEEDYSEFDSTWDKASWDGKPYPGNLCYHLQVPLQKVAFDSTTTAGATVSHDGFTPKEIKSIAQEHTAAGVYPAIKAYGVETEITSFELDKNSETVNVTIKWVGVDNYRYAVYYKASSNQIWVYGGSVSVAGTTNKVVEKTKTINSLTTNTNYHFVVVGGIDIDNKFTGLITQHINSADSKCKNIADNLDSLRAVEIAIPDLD